MRLITLLPSNVFWIIFFIHLVNFQLPDLPSTKENISNLTRWPAMMVDFSSSLLPAQASNIALMEPALVPAMLKKRMPIFSST